MTNGGAHQDEVRQRLLSTGMLHFGCCVKETCWKAPVMLLSCVDAPDNPPPA